MLKDALRPDTRRRKLGDDPTIEPDVLFDVLGNVRRRYVVEVLRGGSRPVTLDELARRVAARENETTVSDVTPSERKLVYTSLQQTHLPKMAQAGALEFDRERNVVVPSDTLTEVTLHMDIVCGHEVPQSVVYLGLTALSVAILLATTLDFSPLSFVPPSATGGLILLFFGSVATIQLLSQRRRDDQG